MSLIPLKSSYSYYNNTPQPQPLYIPRTPRIDLPEFKDFARVMIPIIFANLPMYILQNSPNISLSQTKTYIAEQYAVWKRNFKIGVLQTLTITIPLHLSLNFLCHSSLNQTPQKNEAVALQKFLPYTGFLYTMLVGPLIEEIIFRSILQNGTNKLLHFFSNFTSLSQRIKDAVASKISKIISSLLFAYVHYNSPYTDLNIIIILAITSYFFECRAYEKDGLAGSFARHMANNLISSLPKNFFMNCTFCYIICKCLQGIRKAFIFAISILKCNEEKV